MEFHLHFVMLTAEPSFGNIELVLQTCNIFILDNYKGKTILERFWYILLSKSVCINYHK